MNEFIAQPRAMKVSTCRDRVRQRMVKSSSAMKTEIPPLVNDAPAALRRRPSGVRPAVAATQTLLRSRRASTQVSAGSVVYMCGGGGGCGSSRVGGGAEHP
eukprot:6200015-Pleurochrysis_carterae.AAC.1